MLRVHTEDGLTTSVDLEDKGQAEEWLEKLKNPTFQAKITGLTISHRGVLYSFTQPDGFHSTSFYAENVPADPAKKIKGGERLLCFADGVRLGVMVHREQRAVRITLAKTGRQRFSPFLR